MRYALCERYVKNAMKDNVIVAGVFAGVKFTDNQVFGTPMAKLLGTYEMELRDVLSNIGSAQCDRLINVGGAEGYYAVGGAVSWDIQEVIVYEALEEGRKLITCIAKKNGVLDKMRVLGNCSEDDLYALSSEESRDILIMDIEGNELRLLSERVLDRLRKSIVVVEAHDFVCPGCSLAIRKRLQKTHDVSVISSQTRTPADFPLNIPVTSKCKTALMNERRPGIMEWVIGMPHN